jgi:hypothetical protein
LTEYYLELSPNKETCDATGLATVSSFWNAGTLW